MAKDPSNKKGNSKDNVKKGPQKSSFQCGKVLFTVFSIIGGIASYLVYRELFTTSPLPDLDLQEWWGTYPINPNPDKSIRPFKIEFSDVIINDLRERLLHRRPFAPPLEGAGFTYGFNSAFLTRVLDYWQHSYKFQEREQFLNKYPHYKTNVQGLDIHYIHVKPRVEEGVEVVPILLLHGWPGSVREFYEVIPLLTTPRPGAGFVFEIIAPSLPGYGFSQGTTRPGLSSTQMAVIMRNLMHRVGLPRFYVQGGDWGAIIGGVMATVFPNEVMGLHTNMPSTFHPLALVYTFLGSFWPSAVSSHPEEQTRMYPLSERVAFIFEESGYSHLHATKPDTVGIALTDSPAGLAAYILEKFSTWTDPKYRLASDGNLLGKYALTNLLDNIMIYWTTNSITTSVRLYAESFGATNLALKMDQIPTDVPTWGLKMKHELITQPDCAIRVKYRNYLHTTLVGQGGHFAAFELPEVVADDIYKAVQMFRSFHGQSSKKTEKSAPDAQTTTKNSQQQGTTSKNSQQQDTTTKNSQQGTTQKPSQAKPSTTPPKDNTPTTIYDFVVKDINGKEVKLDKYRGHVTLIVNVASQCGLTATNYKQLNELYDKYADTKGLRILAFPCNQFGSQEPGNMKDILTFTKAKGVKFDLFEKVEVNGENAHPLWKFLKQKQGGTITDAIKWNFSKFIVDKNGVPVERLAPTTEPLSLEPILAKYW